MSSSAYGPYGSGSTPPPSPFNVESSSSRRPEGGSSTSLARKSLEDPRARQDSKVDQIVQHLYSKVANVISSARLTHLSVGASKAGPSRRGSLTSPATTGPQTSKRIDKWFNLELEDPELFREELRTWRSVTAHLHSASSAVPSLVLDVILDTSDLPASKTLVLADGRGRALRVGVGRRSPNILLERWTIDLKPPGPPNPPPLPGVYKQGIILFRALYALVQALPASDLQRRLQRRIGGLDNGLKIGCRLSTGSNSARLPDDEFGLGEALTDDRASAAVERFPFAPIQTPVGLVHLECIFRKQAEFSVQDFEAFISSHFFDEDYFRSAPTVRQPMPTQPGSMPSTGRITRSPRQDIPSRPSYGSLSSRHVLEDKPPTPTSQQLPLSSASPTARPALTDYLSNQEGAFVTASRTRSTSTAVSVKSKASEASPTTIPRRPSVGQGHPYRASPTSVSPSPLRLGSSASPRDILPPASGRMSSSPGFGPSSSLRYQSPSYFDAMHHAAHGSVTGSGSSTRPSAPALKRHSSRGAYGASSSSGGSGSPAPGAGPSSLSGRHHLSSSAKRESIEQPTPEERDEIAAFLELLDQKPPIAAAAASSGTSRAAVDDRLRALASSMFREGEPALVRPRVSSRLSIEEERVSPRHSPPVQGSGGASGSSGAISSQPVASTDSFPRYISPRRSRRHSAATFDEGEAVGRLELSQEEPTSTAEAMASASPGPILHQPLAHRSGHRHTSRPTSAMSSRRESSVDAESMSSSTGAVTAAHHMQLGRGRGRPGRHRAQREAEWEERRLEREQRSGSNSVAGSSQASSRNSSVGSPSD